ncbi:M23 family metallopeptidase [Candidatus Latescibacterota bacterium]
MAAEKDRWISIMIVPEDGAGMRKWRVTSRKYSFLKATFVATCIFLFIGFISMIALGVMYYKLLEYKTFNTQLLEATSQLETIAARLDKYKNLERNLRAILGSDLNLPEPIPDEPLLTKSTAAPDQTVTGLNEIEQAIADFEAKNRKRPTMWPVNPWQITQGFVNTGVTQKDHYGIDILAPSKSIVVASADGRVTFAGRDKNLGLLVIIDHENDWVTNYGHNASLLVESGDSVKKGERIAVFGGADGASTGSHLHFGMFYKGQPKDPLVLLGEKQKLKITGLIK